MASIQPFKATLPRLDRIFSSAYFFAKVKHFYTVFKKGGYFYTDKKPGIYIYRQRTAERTQIGILALTNLDDYFNGKIVKHEDTLAIKEERMMALYEERQAVIKPILLTYPKVETINTFITDYITEQEPFFENNYSAAIHTFWKVKSVKQQKKLMELFDKKVPKTYIADGHHRVKTSSNWYENLKNKGEKLDPKAYYNFFPCALFSSDQLVINDFNRIIHTLNGMTPLAFLAALSKVAIITPIKTPFKPQVQHQLVMSLGNEWFQLDWKKEVIPSSTKRSEQLDVTILNDFVLNAILGIKDIRSDSRIKYVEGTKGIEGFSQKMPKSNDSVGFLLPSISIEDFIYIADNEGVMPPKSTYFTPRMHNGFIVQDFV